MGILFTLFELVKSALVSNCTIRRLRYVLVSDHLVLPVGDIGPVFVEEDCGVVFVRCHCHSCPHRVLVVAFQVICVFGEVISIAYTLEGTHAFFGVRGVGVVDAGCVGVCRVTLFLKSRADSVSLHYWAPVYHIGVVSWRKCQ